MSGASLSTAPTCFYTRIESHLFPLIVALPSPLAPSLCSRLGVHIQPALDARRFEVVAEGLPLFSEGAAHPLHHAGVPVHADGTARPGAAQLDGVALVSAKRLKERKPTQSWWAVAPGPDWSCSRAKLAAVGLGKRQSSCACWPKRKPEQSHPSSGRRVCFGRPGGCDLVLRCRTGVRLLVAEPSWRARCRW